MFAVFMPLATRITFSLHEKVHMCQPISFERLNNEYTVRPELVKHVYISVYETKKTYLKTFSMRRKYLALFSLFLWM